MSDRKKVLFVGDNHISGKTPANRIGSYLEDTVNKLKDCLNIGREEKVDAIVLLGDLFDVREVTPEARNLTLAALRSQENGLPWPFPVYITVGNHDIQSSFPLDKSSLGTLIAAGFLKKEDYVPELGIAFAHFHPDLDKNILEGLLVTKHPNNSLIISGHIHHPMSYTRSDGKRFINPGAIGRTSATKDSLTRILKVYLLEYDLDGTIYNEKYLDLPSAKPAELVFKLDQIETTKQSKTEVKEFIKSISNMKQNNWLHLHDDDKLNILISDAKEDGLVDDIIAIISETFKAVKSVSKEESN
jgi:DNA repair exonuclease SbcCD nuclease subunit